MIKNTSEIIGFIGGTQTLVEKFPMSILDATRGKTYTSVIDFILDILKTIGIDDRVLLLKIIQLLFDVPNFNEVSTDLMNRVSKMDYESDFVNKIEDSLKVIISNILTAILSCSVIPEIYNNKMDNLLGKDNEGFMSIPLSLIDYSGMLNVCPLDKIGKNFYNVDDTLTVNTLYKSYDLNAFIWYCLNRGISQPQKEKNKMVWDNRYDAQKENDLLRNTNEKWNEWYNSKTNKYDKLYVNNDKNNEILFPIMQLERENYFDGEKRLRVYISAQTYFNNGGFNKSIYNFNSDYLKSIRILSTKSILSNMIQQMLGGLFLSNPIVYTRNQVIIDAQINQIIKNVLEEDDTQISDCYYTFSNDEYNKMLEDYDLLKYNSKRLNSETSGAVEIDVNEIINSINSISSAATSHEKIEKITKTIFDITAIPSKDGAIIESDKLGLTYNNSWINEIIKSIVTPIVRSVMSPQVMLLLIINMETTGLIKLNDLSDISNIMDLIYKKIFALLKSIIIFIKDKIVDFLIDLFFNEIKPLFEKYIGYLALEQLQDWIRLLRLVKEALPHFKLSNYAPTSIDDVNYADIYTLNENIQNIPNKNRNC